MKRQTKDKFTRLDYLAVMPLLLMLGITFLMLLMDILMPSMDQGQYESYPAFFRGANVLICISGLSLYISLFIKDPPYFRSRLAELKLPVLFFLLFISWIMISTLVNGATSDALHGVSLRNIGVPHIIAFMVFYMGSSCLIRNSKFKKLLLYAFMGLSCLISLAVIADKCIYPIAAFREKKDISGIFFNGNHLGYFLVMAILISLGMFLYSESIRERIFSAAIFVLDLIVLLMNGSMGCLIAVFSGVVLAFLICARGKKKTETIVLASLIIAGLAFGLVSGELASLFSDISDALAGDETAGHNRWLLWTTVYRYIIDHPVFGYGCEGLRDTLMDTVGRANCHNEILNYALWFGVSGALLYVLGTCSCFFVSLKDKAPFSTPCLLASFGYFVSALFGVPMFYTVPFFFIFLGMALPARDEA